VMNKGESQVWNEGELGKKLAEIIVAKHKQKKGNTEKKTNITGAATFAR